LKCHESKLWRSYKGRNIAEISSKNNAFCGGSGKNKESKCLVEEIG